MGKGRWPSRRDLKEAIKETFFDTELLDPRSYDKHTVAEAKERHAAFLSLQDEEFFTIFRRAASEYTLQEDYDNTEKQRKSARSQQHTRPAASKIEKKSNNLAPDRQHSKKAAALKLMPNKASMSYPIHFRMLCYCFNY